MNTKTATIDTDGAGPAPLSLEDQILALLASAGASDMAALATRLATAAGDKAVAETAAWEQKQAAAIDSYLSACNELSSIDTTQMPVGRVMMILVTAAGAVAHRVETVPDAGALALIANRSGILSMDVRPQVDAAAWGAAMTGWGKRKARAPRADGAVATAGSTSRDRLVTPGQTIYLVDAAGNFVETSAHGLCTTWGLKHYCKAGSRSAKAHPALTGGDDPQRAILSYLDANPAARDMILIK